MRKWLECFYTQLNVDLKARLAYIYKIRVLMIPFICQGMELYPRIGKSFDIKVFTNCRFGMMSWAVLAVTYCIKQVDALEDPDTTV